MLNPRLPFVASISERIDLRPPRPPGRVNSRPPWRVNGDIITTTAPVDTSVPVSTSVILSFFEIKEVGGVRTLSEKNRIVGF